MDLLAKYNNITLFILDLLLALVFATIIYHIPTYEIALQSFKVWLISLILFWYVTREPEKLFIRGYRHVVRLAFFALTSTIIFLALFHATYSLRALFALTFLWILGAAFLRYVLMKFVPTPIIAGDPLTLDKLKKLENIDTFKILVLDDLNNFSLTSFDYVVFDPQFDYSEKWRSFFVHAKVAGIPVYSIYEVAEVIQQKVSVELLKQNWIANNFVVNKLYLNIKRILDILIIIIFLPILLPLMLTIALISRYSMGKNVIFKQNRVGIGGQVFVMYKFRTMLISFSDDLKETSPNDPRITKVGYLLRKTRLDELPQIYNILKGDMSLIGPRPEWMPFAEQYAKEIPLYFLRSLLRPGITGWAQVNQGHTTGVEGNYEKLRYDIYYIKNCSIWLDLKIIIRTIYIVCTGHGAV